MLPETPWGELKKGIIDLVVAIGVSVTVYMNYGGAVRFRFWNAV